MPDNEEPNAKDAAKSNSSRRSTRVTELMNAPSSRRTPLGCDTAWARKLKDAVDSAVRELHVEVLSAKPLRTFDPTDSNDMLFEMETNKGRLQVIRARSGAHTFQWL